MYRVPRLIKSSFFALLIGGSLSLNHAIASDTDGCKRDFNQLSNPALIGTLSNRDNWVLFDDKLRQNTINFLKRQLDDNPELLNPLIDLLNEKAVLSENGTRMIDLGVLTEMRAMIEKLKPDFWNGRAIHGSARLLRRSNELAEIFKWTHHQVRSQSRPGSAETALSLQETKIVDIGAGSGQIIEKVATKLRIPHSQVYGVELAMYPGRSEKINWLNYDRTGYIPVPDHSADYIILEMVLHHAPDPHRLMRQIYHILKPGGRVIVRETDAGKQEALQLNRDQMVALNQILDNMLYTVFDPNSGVPMKNNYQPKSYWEQIFKDLGYQVRSYPTREPRSPFHPIFMILEKPLH